LIRSPGHFRAMFALFDKVSRLGQLELKLAFTLLNVSDAIALEL
jgi:hypothetical protein